MRAGFLEVLKDELKSVDEAAKILEYSFENCRRIGIKNEYSFPELDQIEAFTGRFARLSDMLIQKIFRLIDNIELEEEGTVRDRINGAEKKGLITSAELFAEIRIVRNDIAHEYKTEAVREIYKKTLELTPCVLDSVKRVRKYCKKYW